MILPRIGDAFAHDDPDCPNCRGDGMACEEHPADPMGHPIEVTSSARGERTTWFEECGAPGIPCPRFADSSGRLLHPEVSP